VTPIPFVFVTTHRVEAGTLPALTAMTREYTEFVESEEPDLVAHLALLSPDADELALVQIHRDAASAERHLEVAGPRIHAGAELAPPIGIAVYGDPGPLVRQALEVNAERGVDVTIQSRAVLAFARW
jgi:hypothetical protein